MRTFHVGWRYFEDDKCVAGGEREIEADNRIAAIAIVRDQLIERGDKIVYEQSFNPVNLEVFGAGQIWGGLGWKAIVKAVSEMSAAEQARLMKEANDE